MVKVEFNTYTYTRARCLYLNNIFSNLKSTLTTLTTKEKTRTYTLTGHLDQP